MPNFFKRGETDLGASGGGGGAELIAEAVRDAPGTSILITGIPQTFKSLRFVSYLSGNFAEVSLSAQVVFNDDAAAVTLYDYISWSAKNGDAAITNGIYPDIGELYLSQVPKAEGGRRHGARGEIFDYTTALAHGHYEQVVTLPYSPPQTWMLKNSFQYRGGPITSIRLTLGGRAPTQPFDVSSYLRLYGVQ